MWLVLIVGFWILCGIIPTIAVVDYLRDDEPDSATGRMILGLHILIYGGMTFALGGLSLVALVVCCVLHNHMMRVEAEDDYVLR